MYLITHTCIYRTQDSHNLIIDRLIAIAFIPRGIAELDRCTQQSLLRSFICMHKSKETQRWEGSNNRKEYYVCNYALIINPIARLSSMNVSVPASPKGCTQTPTYSMTPHTIVRTMYRHEPITSYRVYNRLVFEEIQMKCHFKLNDGIKSFKPNICEPTITISPICTIPPPFF